MGSRKRVLRGAVIALTAALAGYVTWDRLEAYRLNREIEDIGARGEPVDLSSLEQTPSTPQELEAAQLYAEAARRTREVLERDGRLANIDVDAVVGRVNVGEIESTFRTDGPAMQLLDRAATLPFSGFGGAIDGPDWAASSGMQALNGLACLRSDLLAYRGDGDAAAAALLAAIRLHRTVPDMVAQSFLSRRQLGSLRILLRHSAPSAAALETLQKAVAELPDDDLIQHDVLLRRARFIEAQGDPASYLRLPAVAVLALHPFLVRTARVQLEQYPQVLLAARTPWPDKIGALAALAESPGNRDGRTSLRRTIVGPPPNIAALSASPVNAAMRLAGRRLMLATVAIERYRRAHGGQPPAALAAMVPTFLPAVPIDPFSGAPLVYTPSPADYLVYSLDTNRKDDGGDIYGLGSRNPMPLPRVRDLGIRVPLVPHAAQ